MSAAVRSRDFPLAKNRARISAEARGQLRLLWGQLSVDADQVRRAVEAIPVPMLKAAATARVGANAALDRMAQRLPLPLLSRAPRRAIWRFLQPTAGSDPPAIEVWAVLLGAPGRPPIAIEAFGLQFSFHSLGRMIDQDPKVDLREAMLEAHDHLALLPTTCGKQVFGLSDVLLPAGPGAFLVSPPSRDHEGPMLVAKTWVHSSQFTPRQSNDFVAWGRFASALISA